jgi:ppGpp synthetase/RelA/SpoT-type nucleotidyltranferase
VDEQTAREIYDAEIGVFEAATQALKGLLEGLLAEVSAAYGVRDGSWVSGKAKGFESFYEKVKDGGCTDRDSCLERVRDFGRARVVVQTVDDVYRMVELLEDQEILAPDWGSVEDYIEDPQERGYRSYHIHVDVEIPVETRKETILCELQIRSAIQHAWSGFSHKDFYKGGAIPAVYEDQMGEMSSLLASVDRMAAKLIEHLNEEGPDAPIPPDSPAPAPAKPARFPRLRGFISGKGPE